MKSLCGLSYVVLSFFGALNMKRVLGFLFGVLATLWMAAPAAAWTLNDSSEPGSVLVFPKWREGTWNTLDQGIVPITEFEISVKCPNNPDGTPFDCTTLPGYPNVQLKAHWVCAGDMGREQPGTCHETDFPLQTTVNGTLHLTTETSVNQLNGAFTFIPPPPCENFPDQNGDTFPNDVYLIVWAIDANGNAIKFDGLIGDAVLREVAFPNSNEEIESYNAIPIQAAECLNTGDLTDVNMNGALDFDGTEYKMVTGVIIGTVRYEGNYFANAAAKLANTPTGTVKTFLTLLTLDVQSNRSNNVTYVDLNFFKEDETPHSTATSFVCYATQELAGVGNPLRPPIDTFLTIDNMGRKGLVVSGPAQRLDGTHASVLAILEVHESANTGFGTARRDYANALYNDSTPVTTAFQPNAP
jgi:hypothetical protein